ncbi:unnamed protein product [Brassica rapa]|uniref:Uncharacterized protein n=1 Tax=Brassica campestris TaxID=3711 RepID=A0A8D9H832_BRACM|nr:unnamed protein product [Brassica rapa]
MKSIVCDAVEIERKFVCDALPCALVGMNRELMSQYIEFMADRLLGALGYGRCTGKTNFFEKRVGDYQKASVMSKELVTTRKHFWSRSHQRRSQCLRG